MEAFAELQDVIDISGPLTAEQTAAIPGLLAQASTKLRGWGAERGVDIDALITGDNLRTEIAKGAVANAAKRAAQNLDGIYETSFAIDDYRETNRRDKTTNGEVIINIADLAGLLPAKGARRFGTIRLGSAL